MQNVVFKTKIIFKKRGSAAFFLFIFALTGFGCNSTSDSICQDFPQIREEISGIQMELAALDTRPGRKLPKGANRRIASALPPSPTPEFLSDRQEAWMEWGEKALKRTQWSKDALEGNRPMRKAVLALNDAGMALVSFHGYLVQKKWRKAENELTRAELSLGKARSIACEVKAISKPRN